jgi:hypothetical protein
MANAHHVIGSEPPRAVRYLNVLFGVALLATPFVFDVGTAVTFSSTALIRV